MLIKLVLGFFAAVVGVLGAGLLFLVQGGFATVYVDNPEMTLYVPVPMRVAELAVAFAPEEELGQVRKDLEPFRELILAALQVLDRCPDAVLVEVHDGSEEVVVEKKGDELIIDVQSAADGHVNVQVPLASVLRIVTAVVT
jgi:hypothetical protein